jgi:signal peptidase II
MTEAHEKTGDSAIGGIRLWSSQSGVGLIVALFALAADQIHKYWMLEIYRIAEKGSVAVTSFLNLIMVWNPGISYGLFPAGDNTGRMALIGLSVAAIIVLYLWMANASSRLVAISIALIIGGAIGNLIDRLVHGAVADFFSLHFAGFYWYVFNVADVAITIGVMGLIVDWLFPGHTKVPKSV